MWLFLGLVFAFVIADDVVLKPTNSGPTTALIFIQGASIPPERYIPLMTQIQQQTSGALWVGMPEFLGDIPEPLVLGRGIQRIIQTMLSMGVDVTKVPLFFSAHSMGGAMLQAWLNGTSLSSTKGMIFFGSFLTRTYRDSFTVPTFTIGAELDGLCRVTRIAEAFYTSQIAPANGRNPNNFPVALIPGMSHFQFASGSPPIFVYENDFKPSISNQDAYQAASGLASAFINQQNSGVRSSVISKAVSDTAIFVKPLYTALLLEGFNHFKPPCDQGPVTPACTPGSPWVDQFGPQIMFGVDQYGVGVINKDQFHEVWIIPVHLPIVYNTCKQNSNCNLNTTTISQCIYDTLDPIDTGFSSTSAFEIKTKIKSRQTALKAIGIDQPFNISDAPSLCGMINQRAIQWAAENSGVETKTRFDKFGVPMVVGEDDVVTSVGPVWIWTFMGYDQKEVNGTMSMVVTSVVMKTPLDQWPEEAAGMHYCKLLSPARAIEWIYVDGLRYRLGLSSN